MKTPDELFAIYSESHRNPTNKKIHWIAIPAIVVSLLGILWSIAAPVGGPWANAGTLLVALAMVYYLRLSRPLAVGMGIFGVFALGLVWGLSQLAMPLWLISLLIFFVAWVFQFIGHKIEGKKPSFLEDVQYLLVGPLWLLGHIYRRIGISY